MSHVIRGGKCAVTSTLEEMMEKNEIIGRWAPFMQEFGFDEGTNTI